MSMQNNQVLVSTVLTVAVVAALAAIIEGNCSAGSAQWAVVPYKSLDP
jgi:hypothetical protein